MITKNIVRQPKAQVDIEITVPWADIEKKWNDTLAKMAQDVELPGFRKGTAPLPMVEQNLGKKLEDEVFKVVMPQALIDALTGTDVVPIDYPFYQIISFQKNGELKFTAKVTERPTIKIGDYKAIKVAKPTTKVIDNDQVNRTVNELFRRWRVKNPLPGGNPTPQTPVTPPAQSNGAAGGSLTFNNAQTPTETPATDDSSDQPDDSFAKAIGAQSLDDLKSKIKQDLEAEAKYEGELDYEESILQQVEGMTQVDVPDILIQDEINRMMLSLQRNVTERGLLMDEYLKTQNKTLEQLKDEWKIQAEKNVRMELGLSEVAKQEGVNISDQELQAEIDKITDARVKAQFQQEEPRMHLRHALRQTKTLNLLKTLVG